MDLLIEEDHEFSVEEIKGLASKIDAAYVAAERAWEADGSRLDVNAAGKMTRAITEPVRTHLVRIAHMKRTLRAAIERNLAKADSLEHKLELLGMHR